MFDSFPWPQNPTAASVKAVAKAAVDLRAVRRAELKKHGLTLRELYRSLDVPGRSPLRDAHEELDKAVRVAYGMGKSSDPLTFLLELNQEVVSKEDALQTVVGPGLPSSVKNKSAYVTIDRLRMP